MKITLNRCKCLKCNDIITSRHVHDFVMCKCGACFTDGGNEYCRRGGYPEFILDMSIYDNGLAIIIPAEDKEKYGTEN